ncbi:hypothetical protein NDU88_007509, partial [Pleurodeles waltl]
LRPPEAAQPGLSGRVPSKGEQKHADQLGLTRGAQLHSRTQLLLVRDSEPAEFPKVQRDLGMLGESQAESDCCVLYHLESSEELGGDTGVE